MLHTLRPARAALIVSLVSGLSGCFLPVDPAKKQDDGPKKPAAQCLGLVNGTETTKYPSVAFIGLLKGGDVSGTCTATFVAKNALLTASHCTLSDDPQDVVYIEGARIDLGDTEGERSALIKRGIHPSKVLILSDDISGGGAEDGIDIRDSHRDLAVLIFDQTVAPAVTPLLGRAPKAGETATLVGYGRTDLLSIEDAANPSDDTVKVKRVGKNKVEEVPTDIFGLVPGVVFLLGAGSTNGSSRALAAQGDSGGPLFVDGRLAGVASSGIPAESFPADIRAKLKGNSANYYADLSDAGAIDFLDKARAAGAKIPRPGDASEGDATVGTGSATDDGLAEAAGEPCG
jgi:hypothetical protein